MPASELRGEPDLDRVLVGMAGACVTVGGAAGVAVGRWYGLDDAQEPGDVVVAAVVGLVVGAFLGLCAAVGSFFVLVAVRGRPWASGSPVRAGLAAGGAAGPIVVLVLVLSGLAVHPVALALCAAVTGLPAATAVVALDRSIGRRRAAA